MTSIEYVGYDRKQDTAKNQKLYIADTLHRSNATAHRLLSEDSPCCNYYLQNSIRLSCALQ